MTSAALFDQLAKLHDSPFFVLNGEGIVVSANESFCDYFQNHEGSLAGSKLDALLAEDSPRLDAVLKKAARTNEPAIGSLRLLTGSGAPVDFPYATIALRPPATDQLYLAFRRHQAAEFLLLNAKVASLSSEIDGHHRTEEEQLQVLQQFRAILDSMDSMIYVADIQTHEVLLINEYGKGVFGEIEGRKCWQTLHDGQDKPCGFCTNDYLLDDEGQPTGVHIWQHKNNRDGNWYELRDQAVLWPDGRYVRLEIATNITTRKMMVDQIHANLEEKELLLKEISHRTKNNMQLIKAILDLKAVTVTDPEMKDVLKETGGRIISMALVHEKLYQSESLSQIDLKTYIRELSEYLLREFNVENKPIALDFEFPEREFSLSLDQSVPCALILSELITNAIKYAFKGLPQGTLTIILTSDDDQRVCLSVRDNGRGLPPDFDLDQVNSFGLKIAKALAQKQLRGTMEFNADIGTTFTFCFDRQPPSVR